MKKIISLYQRNYDGDRFVRDEIVPGAEWVAAGEGVATRKWDGTCCLVRGGKLYKRYEVKPGGKPPQNFEPANETDSATGKQQGWVPVSDGPEDQWHREAFDPALTDGTYELLGPKIQGNPERFYVNSFAVHRLLPHGKQPVNAPRTFAELKDWLSANDVEGIVWHHSDGRMVKIKAKDFGVKRGVRAAGWAAAEGSGESASSAEKEQNEKIRCAPEID